ncbi:MAG: hypothetical protein V8S97_02645 [Oscillospiraceae bacterium]
MSRSFPAAVSRIPELRLFQYTAIDEFTRLRFLAAYPEQSTYSSADFLRKLRAWYARRGIEVECVQTDNGFEFTNRFSNSKRDLPTLFEKTAAELGIPAQRQGGAQPPRGSETLLFLPFVLFTRRLCQAACRPQPPRQQLAHETPPLALA